MPTPEVQAAEVTGVYAILTALVTGILSYLGGQKTERQKQREATEACEQRNRRLEQAITGLVAALEAIGQNNPAVLVRVAEVKAIMSTDHD